MAKDEVAKELLRTNEEVAAENKRLMEENGVIMINLIGEPGTGKTTILEKTLPILKNKLSVSVIEVDIDTADNDRRIAALGVEEVRINTCGAFHLDAVMINGAVRQLSLANLDLIIVESACNLIYPSEFDLGDDLQIMVSSVTDDMDKPAKYPLLFKKASMALINKIDLLPYQQFSLGAYVEQLVTINDTLKIFPISALNGEGIEEVSNLIGRMVWKKRRKLDT